MKIRLFAAVLALGLGGSLGLAQEPPKPGPEHAKFKELVGEWEAIVKFGGGESKGKSVWKTEFNGFHLIQEFEGEFGGMKFQGRGQSSYCPASKKYISTWIDSMSASPMVMKGSYDADGKVFTEVGEGPNMEGKLVKHKSVTKWIDKDTYEFKMYQAEGDKDVEMMTITYKRKK